MSYKVEDILYETKDFFVIRVDNGVEVYKIGITHATRCAQIYLSKGSLERGIIECDKRQNSLGE